METTEAGVAGDETQNATLLPESTTGGAPPGRSYAMAPSAFGRYLLLRPHARGGLGEVFLARDQELGRDVALKQIQDRHADDMTSRVRFVREAEITGNLEHPGVVPVYGFGRSPDGRPYYAMRFIQGESLEAAVARFHEAEGPGRDPGERAMERVRLLKRFNDVCDTMEYAHSRGVLHRDLKPSNIMLGPHGETIVVDWGLAKPIGRPEPDDPADGPEGGPVVDAVVTATASDQTLPGSPLGTPAFMSPEQAAGRVDALRPSSDVYNLGATLYCLLAGRPPFESAALGELLGKIQRGDFPPPRSVARGPVPRALEAVCLKAMAHDPADRYPSARALAEEVLRWVADEPVLAYSESGGERFRRWSRRHKKWVRGVAALLACLLLVLSAATYAVNRARRREHFTRLRAEGLASSLMLDQGLSVCEAGAPGSGLLRLARARAIAPPGADDLRRAILANLSAWGEASGALRLVVPHPDEVLAAAYRPDGRAVASGGPGGGDPLAGEARVWDAATGRPIGPPLPHPGRVTALAFTADGAALLTGSDDGSARLWDPATGRPLGPPLAESESGAEAGARGGPVSAVAVSPDGRILLSAAGRRVRLWDAATRGPLPSPADHPDAVRAAAFSPDGTLLLTGSEDGSARLWDVARRAPAGAPLAHGATVFCVAFSPDGRTFVTGGEDGLVRFWETGSRARLLVRVSHRSEVLSAAFRADGRALITGGGDNTAVVWDPSTGLPLGQPMEHRGTVRVAAFAPDGKTALTGSSDGAARVWDPPAGRPLRAAVSQPGRSQALAVHPGGAEFVAAYSDGTTAVLDAATLRRLGPPVAHPGPVHAASYSPDGRSFATGGSDGLARVWDAATRRATATLRGHKGAVNAVAFVPGGRTVLTGGEDATVRLWDAAGGGPAGRPWPQPSAVLDAAVSPDGRTAAVACGGTAHLWDVATGRPLGVDLRHEGPVYAVAFAPGGRVVATGSEDNTVRLWDAATGEPVGSVLEHQATVRSLAFSPDGRTLLTGANDQVARLWDAATGRPVGPPLLHVGAVTAVAFLPGGRSFLTGGRTQTRLWDAPAPLRDDAETIRLWARVVTGLALDTRASASGVVVKLRARDWQADRLRLDSLGGAAAGGGSRRPGNPL